MSPDADAQVQILIRATQHNPQASTKSDRFSFPLELHGTASNMCHRLVPYTSFNCGHSEPSSEGNKVDCTSNRCRYSNAHAGPSCGERCSETCTQWMRPTQTAVTQASNIPCYKCRLQFGHD
ncbi:hypothetical protein BD410DRAFT_790675 [Rickenella mellea]|uniref:Uncharacterized protein n=1 Tax=Rickenella mellea TaxID=50990 RepID=A0A4Y7Q1G0_9AGAM|nr:hypothetical protein BD410DRAFT_790675 [Rickenella mellea]